MAIINNLPCPACQETGHDRTGNHLMVFEDGGQWCGKHEFHVSRAPYYVPPDGENPILNREIDGKTKYTPAQYRELEETGKLADAFTRQLALSGMRERDRWEVMTEEERDELREEWLLDAKHFGTLKIRNLVSRHIRGEFAKLYDVRVGLDVDGKTARHYYPQHVNGKWDAAKCRNLPKDFKSGHLGCLWGDHDLFGEHTVPAVLESGRRMDTLLLVGGELDALAAQQMLSESQKGTKYEGTFFHVWSPTNGEASEQQFHARRESIGQFKKIILCFDDDDVGHALTRAVARMFPGKTKKLVLPKGIKDPNEALMHGYAQAFVDAWWNPKECFEGTKAKSLTSLAAAIKKAMPKQGLSWPWPSLNKLTLGLRPHNMYVWGAGTGVGKTEVLRHVAHWIVEQHGEGVGVFSTEDPIHKVAQAYVGKWIGKRIELPPTNDPSDPDYRKLYDYTEDERNDAIDMVAGKELLFFGDLSTSRTGQNITDQIDEMMSMGVRHFLIDNLTGVDVDGKGSEREGIDAVMQVLGQYKDEKEITIHLVTHLRDPGPNRTPYEQGGDVFQQDYRGSRSIGFWANYMLAVIRNVEAVDISERTTTYIKVVKDRDQGIHTGSRVTLLGDLDTGMLQEPSQRRLSAPVDKDKGKGCTQGETPTEGSEFE